MRFSDPLFGIGFQARCSITINHSIFQAAVLPDLGRVHAVAIAAFPRARAISAVLPGQSENTVVTWNARFVLSRGMILHWRSRGLLHGCASQAIVLGYPAGVSLASTGSVKEMMRTERHIVDLIPAARHL